MQPETLSFLTLEIAETFILGQKWNVSFIYFSHSG